MFPILLSTNSDYPDHDHDSNLLKLVISSPANVTVPLDGDETMLIVLAVIVTVSLILY